MRPIDIRDIRKCYGKQIAVDGVSFAVEKGKCVGLLGPNGAGKTTTLRICLAATKQDAGEVRLFGLPMPDNALPARARIGVVPQHNMLDPDFNCEENLLVYATYFGIGRAAIAPRIPHLLDFAGITKRRTEPIGNLSGGMQRRLALARALVNNPELIFLDEPTTGLDPQARHLIWERLHRLQADGKTLLLTTHFLQEAERLCDDIYIMDGGKIIADGSPRELINRAVEKNVIELFGGRAKNLIQQNGALINRAEIFGSLIYCYCDDVAPLRALLEKNNLPFLHRPANLEDVFLKLTGRELRE